MVLPFASLSAEAGDAYLADGLTEDLTTDLLGIPELFVVARNSAFGYQGRQVDPEKVGRELGVRYVVQGSVRRDADRVRVTVDLTDATTGFQIWSARYDRVLSDLFALQSDVSEEILAALNLRLEEAEIRRIRQKPTESLTAYEAVKRANAEFYRFEREAHARARGLYERAIELDPAYALLANVYNYEYMGDHIASRLALAEHYEDADQPEEARTLLREVLRINPDFQADRARLAGGRLLSEEAARRLEKRLRTLREASDPPEGTDPS